MIDHYHGSPSIYGPFDIVNPARKRGTPKPEEPELDLEYPIVVTRSDKYPELRGVFWLVSGRGRGREAIQTDRLGNVKFSLTVTSIGIGTPGVQTSNFNAQELNFDGFLHSMLAAGQVRVDHLRDENGEPMGYPTEEESRDRVKWRDWTWRIANATRLQQLAEELEAAEPGRRLSAGWMPRVRSSIETRLLSHVGKTSDGMNADRKTLATAREYLVKAAGKIAAAIGADRAELPPMAMADRYGRMGKTSLRTLCRQRGLDDSGKIDAIVERLRESDAAEE